jgi:pimeloyl-ACP methyl ester carboxylesterase
MSQSRSLDFKEATINYFTSGEGHPVIFIHGFGEDGKIWENIINTISADYKIIVLDLPGSGKSSLLHSDNKTIGVEDYAEVIQAILEKENISKIVLIGHSMGGYVALAFAELYPAMLSGLGLFHSTSFNDDDKKKETRLKGINFVKNNGAQAFLKTSIPAMFAEEFQKNNSVIVDDLVYKGINFTNEAVIQYYTAMMNRKDRSDVLRNIPVPVLIIIGEKDQAVPLDQSLKQTHLPAKSLVKILPNAAHMGMLENTSECIAAIQQFLNITTETMKVN